MKKQILTFLVTCAVAGGATAQSIWDKEHLATVKEHIGDPFYATACGELRTEADRLLDAEPLSVMMKEDTPVSGNKHDYMSLARYFWPDPTKPDGLPYVSRDGLSNPELEKYDRNRLGTTASRVTTLSLAWYFTGDEQYARKATELIRVWFLNKATCMNPHLEFAQVVKGQKGNRGRSFGVIDTYSFVEMLDAVQLLEGSQAFTAKDSKQLKAWFSKLLNWMLTSELGKEERASTNNHAVACDAQLIAFALYTGNQKLAREILSTIPEVRVYTQIEPDGSQPHELRRTLAFHYSLYNLTHLIDIYLMGQKLGLHLDRETSADGRSFYKAMDFLTPYVGKERESWPYQQISGWEAKQQDICKDLYRTAVYLDPSRKDYLKLYRQNRVFNLKDRFNLLYVQASEYDNAFAFACNQLRFGIDCAEKAIREEANAAKRRFIPRTINGDGSFSIVGPKDWCSGFFSGNLWQVYAYTNDPWWRQEAIHFTWMIEEAKWHGGTHDLGFMINDSFGKALELTGERSYRDVVVQAARTLITRFSPKVGCIRSWDHNRDKWQYPVIIDNMMNLEMLFRATQLTGDSVFWKVAVSHADVTMKNHFRPDASSYHVVDYNPETGQAQAHQTHQGYADDSFWSRGQGWGLYGYAMCYRFTKNPAYLQMSERIADFWMALPNMPEDHIPYWDMKDPRVAGLTTSVPVAGVPRDASAAALIASGLYELSTYVDAAKGARYRAEADKIVESLNKYYRAEVGTVYGFLLLHSTGHHPAGVEIDVPLSYADYYYLEALLRKEALENGSDK